MNNAIDMEGKVVLVVTATGDASPQYISVVTYDPTDASITASFKNYH